MADRKGKAKDDSLDLSSRPLPAGPPPSSLHAGLYKLTLSSTSLSTLGFLSSTPLLSLLKLSSNPGLASLPNGEWMAALEPLRGLCVLNISGCGLKELPTVVGKLAKLKALVASENELANVESVKDLPGLNTLVVSHNRLKALPSALTTLPQLKKLSAAHNLLASSSLPDLSSLAHLHEVRLAGNPAISTLPAHVSGWGTGRGGRGIEILELGSCGIETWEGLDRLREMRSLVQLGLKGNAVAPSDEAAFEAYKAKVVELVPSLRILDGHRFDPKYLLARSSRSARPAEPVQPPPARSSTKRKSSPPRREAKRVRNEARDPLEARMRAAEAEAEAEAEANAASDEGDEVLEKKPKKRTKAERRARKAERDAAVVPDAPASSEDKPVPKQKRGRYKRRTLRNAEAGGKPVPTGTELVEARNPALYDESGKGDTKAKKGDGKTSVVKIVNVVPESKGGKGKGGDGQAVMELFRPATAEQGLGVGTWD